MPYGAELRIGVPMTTSPARASERPGAKGAIRETLLDAASSLMREMDTIDVGILDIAARAEVNHGMIRYYFGSKEGMLLALLDRDVGVRIRQLNALFRLDMSPTERMRIHLEGIIDTYYRIPYLNRLIQAMVRDASAERVHHIAEELLIPIARAQHRIIQDGIAAGEFRELIPSCFTSTPSGRPMDSMPTASPCRPFSAVLPKRMMRCTNATSARPWRP